MVDDFDRLPYTVEQWSVIGRTIADRILTAMRPVMATWQRERATRRAQAYMNTRRTSRRD